MANPDMWNLVLAILGSLGGGGAIVFAFSSFLAKLWAERILRREHQEMERTLQSLRDRSEILLRVTQSQIDAKRHIHDSAFLLEFQSYQAIWKSLVVVRNAALGLRPVLDFHAPAETEDSRREARLQALRAAFASFFEAVELNRPFIQNEIYSKLSELHVQITKESWDYQHGEHEKRGDYWTRALTNAKAIAALSDEVSDLIRKRVTVDLSLP